MFDLKDLRSNLDYDKLTGEFRWRVSGKGIKVGKPTGHSRVDGYKEICFRRKRVLAHRLAWFYVTGRWPKEQIDHINHNRSDNRWSNLREVSHTDNMRNHSKTKANTSGHVGVCWDKAKDKWLVRVRGKFVGYFDDIEIAAQAREAALLNHGFHKNHGKNF